MNLNFFPTTEKAQLSFAGERLLRGRHKIHPYPAMLHPLLVDYLLETYAKDGDVVFDPFCGSGVVLLQSNTHGYESAGYDINPLALLIAKVKTTKYDVKRLQAEFAALSAMIRDNKEKDVPPLKNEDHWYTKKVVNDLGRIRSVLLQAKKDGRFVYQNFFVICFAHVCRHQSLTRKGEFKRYRVEESKIKDESLVFEKYDSHIQEMIKLIESNPQPLKDAHPTLANSEEKIKDTTPDYSLVITSPPYGDSKTTVAYGEYSSFGTEWIKDLNPFGNLEYNVDKEALGKAGKVNEELDKCAVLTAIVSAVAASDPKRSKEVFYFFNGYYNAIRNVVDRLASGGRACFVVGNRTVKGIQIPMDQITADFLVQHGMEFETILVRDILNKIMPSENSPTNEKGAKVKTMDKEYIVVAKKK